MKNPVVETEWERVAASSFLPWERLRQKSVLVTGGTGLIGSALIGSLVRYSKLHDFGIHVIAFVRDMKRAQHQFKELLEEAAGELILVQGTVEQLPEWDMPVDYIIHGASPTASAYFVEHPVETILTAVLGTRNLLELAREKRVSGFVYLSSMEVYGAHETDVPIYEDSPTGMDPMSVRSSYPQAKLLCENLCASYCSEYKVPAKVIRLAQTFGAGVPVNDTRVFAYFANAVLHGKDIILRTSGESKRAYLDTVDAVTAILTVLLLGQEGEAYNAANPETYCSILEMAHMVADVFGDGKVQVIIQEEESSIFSPLHRLNLQSDKLCGLGWQPITGLTEMYRHMLEAFQYEAS